MAKDWDRIEREYRANQLSNLEIARQHQISEAHIRKKAKAHGWTKDLSQKVKDQTYLKLVRADGASASPTSHLALANDKAMVGIASDRAVEVVLGHRQRIGRSNALAEKLLGDLEMSYQPIKETDAYADQHEAARHAQAVEMSIKDKAITLREVTNCLKSVIPLERQAYNLDHVEEAKKDTGAEDLRRAQLLESLNATIIAVRKKGELAGVIEGDRVL